MKNSHENILHLGIDIGSTTTKIAVVEPQTNEIIYSDYRRHQANQLQSVKDTVAACAHILAGHKIRCCFTGSGAKMPADSMGFGFVQEVVANSIALQKEYTSVGTAIELGGQDAKIIFFGRDKNNNLAVHDMRMNGSCAGGTGAFIDEMAAVLKTPVEQFNALAEKGSCVYDISGRCGVYAKTDIQPLLNQGVAKADLALSSFHAIAKQTIGGLAQGLDITPPVVFEGGPLTFNPVLIRVFAERLRLAQKDILIPKQPEIMMAYGAALAVEKLYGESAPCLESEKFLETVKNAKGEKSEASAAAKPFFINEKEKEEFLSRHKKPEYIHKIPQKGEKVRAFLGIDSGSTTTKFVLMDESENIIDSFYSPNGGNPLDVAKNALIDLREKYRSAGAELDIIAVGTTGYGEMLFHQAFNSEYHVVETVAHTKAAQKFVPDVSFILDIGGQDMKAVWIKNGVVTNIVVNEACSSGCGSFLENFALALNIPVKEIAQRAFESENPAVLGSRCTVFMNSSIITEQRNGKLPSDIMAGLCRSIIENVFTKVIRVSNLDSLGERIVVQGGTFENDAVLRAIEQHTGRQVCRAPYSGLMGAVGVALLTKEHWTQNKEKTFIGLDALDGFGYTQQANAVCPFCANGCKRTIVRFSNGKCWVTNNRCERGEVLGHIDDGETRELLREKNQKKNSVPNLFATRQQLLFADYPYQECDGAKAVTIGLPRVLSFWDSMPFWKTFWKSLGFKVILSAYSTRKIYEDGLSAVTSDTVCFPAKLVHGHLRNLAQRGADRIFMPTVTTVPSENTEETSRSMCAVVKGYPIVVRNSDNPERKFGIPFDAPLFHWFTDRDRDRQLCEYMQKTFGIDKSKTLKAIGFAQQAQTAFAAKMKEEGRKVIELAEKENRTAVILAGRPYHNDALVNHELPEMFVKLGIPVLTADSVPDTEKCDLSKLRIDVVNNYHARMLSCAVAAANHRNLEYVQIVSFGCGHDAYLSDEIIRIMDEISGKSPLVLKVDESDIQGPLGIRVRSFVETIAMKNRTFAPQLPQNLADSYPVKYTKEHRKEKIILVPNTSHAFCRVMTAAMRLQGVKAEPLDIGREEAIHLGKQYVHNDICFPAQIVIGEALAALRSGRYDHCDVAVGTGKYIGDCRLTHYGALLRKALDDAGYSHVPIITNDDVDYHNMHPGFKMNALSAVRIAFSLPMIDILEELLRKIRPYELTEGSADEAFEKAMDTFIGGLESGSFAGLKKGFSDAVDIMDSIPYDRTEPKPTVLIVGEYLLNFHPGANHDIEKYLEANGLEVIEARMTDVIRKTYFYQDAQIKEYRVDRPVKDKVWYSLSNRVFEAAHNMADSIAAKHPLYSPACRMPDLVKDSDSIIHHTFDAGEGVLIPGEIIHHAKHGCKAFVILQPFGCLPNHVVGRGVSKKLKEMFPDVQILPLDYDPDVSFANIENRLQMLIMNSLNSASDKKTVKAEEAKETVCV
ncbi:MAG: activase [Oscillospiraceae bacterium]|nr:activase [Oscillospiraceae bacterium]